MILMTLLQPSLLKMIQKGEAVACQKNLQGLSHASSIYAGDHDDAIPGNGFSYNDPSTPWWWHSSWGTYIPYTGDRIPNPGDYSFWFSKGHLGQYLFDDNYTGDYQNNKLYDCRSATIRTDPDGKEVSFAFTYWVNVNGNNGKKAPWASNTGLNDLNPSPSWTRFVELGRPNELMSIADVAQNQFGTVDASGAFSVAPHFYDDQPTPWPSPFVNPTDPEAYIGAITPTQQEQRASRRGIFDFRHSAGMNAVFFDGHVENIVNGGLQNKNLYRE